MSKEANSFKKKAVAPVINDPRFAHANKDVRYRKMKKNQTKVQIDPRFQNMFKDKKFQVSAPIDPTGKKIEKKQNFLKKYYNIENEEEKEEEEREEEKGEEEQPEENNEENDEQESEEEKSEEESSSSLSEEEDELSEEEEEEESILMEPKEDIPLGEATKRIAVMNCDWECIKATDLLAIFQSFAPSGGIIKKVTIYPSKFGEERIAQENLEGPKGIWKEDMEVKENPNAEIDEKEVFDQEKLRQYELTKLKYYFAVIECDTVQTAKVIYENCDGMEIETTSNILDLRYIPNDVKIEAAPKETASDLPLTYNPPTTYSRALQQTKIGLSWDNTDERRLQVTTKKFTLEELKEDDFKAYIASSSGDETQESDDQDQGLNEEEKEKKRQQRVREKYKSLLDGILPQEKEEEEMEITFTSGLSEKMENLVQEKLEEQNEDETVWDAAMRRNKEKRKEKKKLWELKKKEEEEKEALEKSMEKKKKKDQQTLELEAREKAELELLTMPEFDGQKVNDKESDDENQLKASKNKKGKNFWKNKKKEEGTVNVEDPRFGPLLTDPRYAIDPTNKKFQKQPSSMKILLERVKRRADQMEESPKKKDISSLVESVKKKTKTMLKK